MLHIPPRDKSKAAPPRPAEGDHQQLVANAFVRVLARYRKAMAALSLR